MIELDLHKSMAQLLHEHPLLAQVLSEKGIDCAACIASQVDTMADVLRMYKLDLNHVYTRLSQLSENASGDR